MQHYLNVKSHYEHPGGGAQVTGSIFFLPVPLSFFSCQEIDGVLFI